MRVSTRPWEAELRAAKAPDLRPTACARDFASTRSSAGEEIQHECLNFFILPGRPGRLTHVVKKPPGGATPRGTTR